MKSILNILTIPLIILNLFGGVVSGVWLAILGEWKTIGIGTLVIILSVPVLGIAGQLASPLNAAASFYYEKGTTILVYFFLFLSSVYVTALVFVWCVGVHIFFGALANEPVSFAPTVIYSYSVALAPWVYMAGWEARSGTGEGSVLITFFAQIGYLVMMVLVLFFNKSLVVTVSVFGLILSIGLLLLWIETVARVRNQILS